MPSEKLMDDIDEVLASSRAPRQSREEAERPKVWQPASTLPEPDKQPGYTYRWVRVSTLGQNDARNISSALREGWEPVRIEEQPQFRMLIDADSRFKDNIEVAGLLLCKVPNEFMEQRREYVDKLTQSQNESVDHNFMRENDARMPLFKERQTRTSFGSGK
tara:strand:- start:3476 stop:3958 length:483 start_codon:yes stop_codon:yes gene_type:complete